MFITYYKIKNKIRYFYFAFIFFVTALVALSFFYQNYSYAGASDTVKGWFWSGNAGWISLNSENCDGIVCTPSGIDYGVTVDGTNVKGSAWSTNYGWICFGETCEDWGNDDAQLAFLKNDPKTVQPPRASFDGIKFSGWANVVALKSDGWIRLQGDPVAIPASFPACYGCHIPSSTCKACFSGINLAGKACYNCTECDTHISPISCANCGSCNQYGMISDEDDNRIYGWAWGGTTQTTGIGWIKAAGKAVSGAYPWLETKYADVYSQNGIQAKGAPVGYYNATYCIHTTGILTAFNSANGCELTNDVATPGYEEIMFPRSTNLYSNILGEIDINKILSGKLGTVDVVTKEDAKAKDLSKLSSDPANHEKVLAGGIYHFEHNLTIDKPFKFRNGNTESGSGLIVVDGDLIINQNMTYDTDTVAKIKQLASVAWLVKGNLRISGDVWKIVGAFYVEGDDGIEGNPAVYTVSSGPNNTALEVYGLMIAPNYSFQRTAASDRSGSERIIYDGRALINTPPGLQDLTKSLPLYREAAP